MDKNEKEQVKELLEPFANGPVRDFSTYDFGRNRDTNCVSAIIDLENVRDAFQEILPEIPENTVLFLGTGKWYGEEMHDGVELVIGPGKDQFDILRLARTDGVNYGLRTEDIIRRLEKYNDNFGIRIYHAETDSVSFEMQDLPDEPEEFLEDLYDLCPDLLDPDLYEVAPEDLLSERIITLWWD